MKQNQFKNKKSKSKIPILVVLYIFAFLVTLFGIRYVSSKDFLLGLQVLMNPQAGLPNTIETQESALISTPLNWCLPKTDRIEVFGSSQNITGSKKIEAICSVTSEPYTTTNIDGLSFQVVLKSWAGNRSDQLENATGNNALFRRNGMIFRSTALQNELSNYLKSQ